MMFRLVVLLNKMEKLLHLHITVESLISMSGISTVYFGSYNNQYGALESAIKLPLNPNLKIYGGLKEKECNKILEDFFERIRNDNKNGT